MNLNDELRAQVQEYLEHRMTLQHLYVWIAERVPNLYDSSDDDLIDLTNQVWFLLSDYGSGSLLEEEVRDSLLALVSTQHLHAV